MPDRRLAIAIPTFNRAEILDETIGAISAALRELDIALVIRDDSGDDETERRARAWAEAGLNVDYRHNRPPLGHDANVIGVLMAADAEHVWLLGDGQFPDPPSLAPILRSLSGQDFVFLNARAETDDPAVEHITTPEQPRFMSQRVWEFTLTGATIYGRRVIDWCRSHAEAVAYPNFCQLGLILHFMQSHADTRVTRLARRALRPTRRRRVSYWAPRAVEVFAGDWCRVVGAHPEVFGASRMPQVLRSHATSTGILDVRHLIALRAKDCFSLAHLRTYETAFAAASPVPRRLAVAIATVPVPVAYLIWKLKIVRRLYGRAMTSLGLRADPGRVS